MIYDKVVIRTVNLAVVVHVAEQTYFNLYVKFTLITDKTRAADSAEFVIICSAAVCGESVALNICPLASVKRILIFNARRSRRAESKCHILPYKRTGSHIFFTARCRHRNVRRNALINHNDNTVRHIALNARFINSLKCISLIAVFGNIENAAVHLLKARSVVIVICNAGIACSRENYCNVAACPLACFTVRRYGKHGFIAVDICNRKYLCCNSAVFAYYGKYVCTVL